MKEITQNTRISDWLRNINDFKTADVSGTADATTSKESFLQFDITQRLMLGCSPVGKETENRLKIIGVLFAGNIKEFYGCLSNLQDQLLKIFAACCVEYRVQQRVGELTLREDEGLPRGALSLETLKEQFPYNQRIANHQDLAVFNLISTKTNSLFQKAVAAHNAQRNPADILSTAERKFYIHIIEKYVQTVEASDTFFACCQKESWCGQAFKYVKSLFIPVSTLCLSIPLALVPSIKTYTAVQMNQQDANDLSDNIQGALTGESDKIAQASESISLLMKNSSLFLAHLHESLGALSQNLAATVLQKISANIIQLSNTHLTRGELYLNEALSIPNGTQAGGLIDLGEVLRERANSEFQSAVTLNQTASNLTALGSKTQELFTQSNEVQILLLSNNPAEAIAQWLPNLQGNISSLIDSSSNLGANIPVTSTIFTTLLPGVLICVIAPVTAFYTQRFVVKLAQTGYQSIKSKICCHRQQQYSLEEGLGHPSEMFPLEPVNLKLHNNGASETKLGSHDEIDDNGSINRNRPMVRPNVTATNFEDDLHTGYPLGSLSSLTGTTKDTPPAEDNFS